ncbi:MAG: hypothetical protein J0M36_08465, partial [Caulobacterales bacterium]|nr:hypothetical protein [Caulobacterales bacterium]
MTRTAAFAALAVLALGVPAHAAVAQTATAEAPPPPAVAPPGAKVIPATYTVLPGQSLWSIANDVLGKGDRYI